MKTFNLNIGGSKDIIIQVPDDIEMQREEAYAMALVKLQEVIVDGVYPINQRVWPCIFCDKCFTEHTELIGHVRSQEHMAKAAGIQKLADKHLQKQQEEPTTYHFEPSRNNSNRGSTSEHHKEYMKQYYIRKQLGEL